MTRYCLIAMLFFISCSGAGNKKGIVPADDSAVPAVPQPYTEKKWDTIKVGDLLFETDSAMAYELVKQGEKPHTNTKGDTLFADSTEVLLGDKHHIAGMGVYQKFSFHSKFTDFPAEVYKGPMAAPDFATDRNAKYFITRIKYGCAHDGVNFAGHYTIVQWGCGAECQLMAIVNRIDGKIIYSKIPFDTVDGHNGIEYQANSRMLIVNSAGMRDFPGYLLQDLCEPDAFEFRDEKFIEVH